MKRLMSIVLLFSLLALTITGCAGEGSGKKEVSFADAGWDSIKFHNAIAGLVAEEVFGYSWREVPGSSPVVYEGILNGEIDVLMEEWTQNHPSYEEDRDAGKLQELGLNFDDNRQGFFVPKYVIEGDPERGIEPMAPDLKYVWDVKKYPDIFPDDEDTTKGRIYGSIPGWEIDRIMYAKYKHYKLDENFVYFRPGSEAALTAALSGAYEKGEAIVAYYWEPTWLMGKYDFVLLEDKPHNPDNYRNGESAVPSAVVTVVASNKFVEDNPEFTEFLNNYRSSSDLTSEALSHMQDTGDSYIETAKWFLKEHDDLLDEWLNPEQAKTMRDFLNK